MSDFNRVVLVGHRRSRLTQRRIYHPGTVVDQLISGIIADEAAIGMVNSKTTAVRLIPAIGKKVGEELNFGGLLGCGPVMEVNTNSPAVFVNRGGRIPAPLQSLKN